MIKARLAFPTVVLSKPTLGSLCAAHSPLAGRAGGIEVPASLQPRWHEQSQSSPGSSMPVSGKAQTFWTFLQLYSFMNCDHCKLGKTKLTAEVKIEVLLKNAKQSVI